MQQEAIQVGLYGDTAPVIPADPNWRSDYQRYLDGFEKADDKSKFNAEYGGNHDRSSS